MFGSILFLGCEGNILYTISEPEYNYYIAYDHWGDIYIYNTSNQSNKNITKNIFDTLYYLKSFRII